MDIVPELKRNSHLSLRKFIEANYLTVFTPEEIHISNEAKTTIESTFAPIIQGWKDPQTGLWSVPIIPKYKKT